MVLLRGKRKSIGCTMVLLRGQRKSTGFILLLLRGQRKSIGFTCVLLRGQRKHIGFTLVLLRGQRKSYGFIIVFLTSLCKTLVLHLVLFRGGPLTRGDGCSQNGLFEALLKYLRNRPKHIDSFTFSPKSGSVHFENRLGV